MDTDEEKNDHEDKHEEWGLNHWEKESSGAGWVGRNCDLIVRDTMGLPEERRFHSFNYLGIFPFLSYPHFPSVDLFFLSDLRLDIGK